jgi:hypothetical protein
MTCNAKVIQMLQTAPFARVPLGRNSPNNPSLATLVAVFDPKIYLSG